MKLEIYVSQDGKIVVKVPGDVEFDAAKAAVRKAIEGLRLEGVPVVFDGEIERHRHTTQESQVEVTQ